MKFESQQIIEYANNKSPTKEKVDLKSKSLTIVYICLLSMFFLVTLIYLDGIWSYTKFAGISGIITTGVPPFLYNCWCKSHGKKRITKKVYIIAISLTIASILN